MVMNVADALAAYKQGGGVSGQAGADAVSRWRAKFYRFSERLL